MISYDRSVCFMVNKFKKHFFFSSRIPHFLIRYYLTLTNISSRSSLLLNKSITLLWLFRLDKYHIFNKLYCLPKCRYFYYLYIINNITLIIILSKIIKNRQCHRSKKEIYIYSSKCVILIISSRLVGANQTNIVHLASDIYYTDIT